MHQAMLMSQNSSPYADSMTDVKAALTRGMLPLLGKRK